MTVPISRMDLLFRGCHDKVGSNNSGLHRFSKGACPTLTAVDEWVIQQFENGAARFGCLLILIEHGLGQLLLERM